MTEIEPFRTEVVVPFTGEVVSLDKPEDCARVYSEIRELEQKLRDLRSYLGDALMLASRQQGTKTLRYPGFEVKINTPNNIAWDYSVLEELLDAGLPTARFNDLVMIEQTYKIDGSVAKSIAASNEIYAEIIERAKSRVPRTPSVTVSPTGGKPWPASTKL